MRAAANLFRTVFFSVLLFFVRWFFWFVVAVFYRRKIVGLENIPKDGGVLFVCNHVSWLDGILLYTTLPRHVRVFASQTFVKGWLLNGLAEHVGAILITPGKKSFAALRQARECLQNGECVAIFPEGGITRTGQIKSFEPGFLSILNLKKGNTGNSSESTHSTESPVPIVPVYIGGMFGSMFSYAHGEKLNLFHPRLLEDDVVVAFGKPMKITLPVGGNMNGSDGENSELSARTDLALKNIAAEVKATVEELGVDVMKDRQRRLILPAKKLIRTARAWGGNKFIFDTLGVEMTGRKFLLAMLAVRRVLRREVLSKTEQNVGLLVPMSVGGMLLNAVLTVDRRTVVNLNYTFGNDVLNGCIDKAQLQNVLTSRRMLERFPQLALNATVTCMEDLQKRISIFDKLSAMFGTFCLPTWLLEWRLGLGKVNKHDPLTIIFTSGSTGTPKGAVISHANLMSVARTFIGTVGLHNKDTMLCILPFFHVFGYVGNFWIVFWTGCKGVIHFNPLEPKKVGEMAKKFRCTFFPSTPTFLRGFLRKCDKEDFEHLHTVMAGAEKLPMDVIDSWESKYGHRPSEGFGATELSPVPCINLTDSRIRDKARFQSYRRDGSAGRLLPFLAVKIANPETGERLPPNTDGMLCVKGGIVMEGYYKDPEKTAEVIKDGWYITGDIAKMDDDGFIFITGRLSRMSKIAGEMVPHILIEEAMDRLIRQTLTPEQSEQEKTFVAITSLPDTAKGEKIIVLHRKLPFPPEEICQKMLQEGIAPLWVPRVNNFFEVAEIPVLGTGKLDLRGIKKLAEESFSPVS